MTPAERGAMSSKLYERGIENPILVDRLHDANDGTPLPERCSDKTNATLTGYLIEIGSLSDQVVNESTARLYLAAMWYGFQLGHDYAIEHGSIEDLN